MLALSRNKLRVLTGFLTGYCHMGHMGDTYGKNRSEIEYRLQILRRRR